ncbi:MAG: ABC transporter ATP-binding protein/permease [Deltaproteobacteria bacterium]|jgi:ABC-type multidrug transport system fused ATPase/permease subunit|nr:ABC transporter ATP-binding protein/permease [Deltaproteobacteria bacterium]
MSCLPNKLISGFYGAFVKDFVRIYKVLPSLLRIKLYFNFALLVISSLLETFTLVIISIFALSVTNPEAVASSYIVTSALRLFPPLEHFFISPRAIVGFTSALMVISVFCKCIVFTISNKKTAIFCENATVDVCRKTIEHYINRDYLWHITPESQDAILRVMNRSAFKTFILVSIQLYSNVILCLTLFISLFILEPLLTLIVVAIVSSTSLLLYTFIKKKMDSASKTSHELTIEENKALVAMNRGIREITIYNQQKQTLAFFTNTLLRGVKQRAFLYFGYFLPSQILEVVGFLTIGLLVIIMLISNLPMEEIVSTTSILMLTAWRILPAVNRALAYSVEIRRIRPDALPSLDLLEKFSLEKPTGQPEPDPNFQFEKELTLLNASFNYPASPKLVLKDVSLTIKKGESVGFIGRSGSGKSTLALLISALVPPTSGTFLVDGEPLTPETRQSYFHHLGFVPQNPLILDGSLKDNICCSDWGEVYDEEKLMKVISAANIDFIDWDLLGLDTPLSSTSQELSGGQIQRVAIARALYNSPSILIFDEATSALDQTSENIILRTLSIAKGRLTSILVAHRLSTLSACDRVFWLEDGQIVRSGPPSEIIPSYEEDALRREKEHEGQDANT